MSQERNPLSCKNSGVIHDETPKIDHTKTPIQILHEYAIKSGKFPEFRMESAEGEAHQPRFIYRVTIGDVSCTGEGSSKKAAKQAAAEAAMRILQINPETLGRRCVKPEPDGGAAESQPNSVGTLQELAMQRGWRVPEYTVVSEAGPPHLRQFTVSCRLESLLETATANSKKAAKKTAADNMVARLQSLSGGAVITWTPRADVTLEKLKSSTAEKISLLRRSPLSVPNTDYIQMMLELSVEQDFRVTYIDIDELTVNGQYQCLAELSTSPVTVCCGTGISCSNAQNDAAHHALQYIKVMATSK
ncbi:interferon-inducible double-stranded RNA-dependent protein kinase activator A homolog [Neosynchiropus ocellatus]